MLINHTEDFWEYDPATDLWSEKANFGGTARHLPAAFSTSAAKDT